MRLLVFGRGGQVARAIRNLAPDAMTLDRAAADLADPAACAQAVRAHRPDAVINAAAWTAVDGAEDREAEATVINGEAPGAMARACAALDVPFVHISSDYVFDGSGDTPFRPDAATGPLGAYGRSKLAGERAVTAAGGVSAILRTSWVFDAEGANFVTTMLRLGASRDRISVVEDQTGGPTPADAIAAACLKMAQALRDDPATSGIYHLSGAPDVSWAGFAAEVFRQADVACTVDPIPSSAYLQKAHRPGNSRLDCTSLHETFGISRPDWRAALAAMLSAR